MLGAGVGNRLQPFTSVLPKPLIPVMGVPCMDFALALLQDAGVKDVVVNIHAHADQMRAHLASIKNQNIKISDESEVLLGSAGGYRKALSYFGGETFFGINGDAICAIDLSALEARHRELRKKSNVVMTMALLTGKSLLPHTESYRRIDCDPERGLITGFGGLEKNVPFYSGIGVFEPEAFAALEEGKPAEFVPRVLEPWIQAGRVGYFEFDRPWIDIGSPELWYRAHDQLTEMLRGSVPAAWKQKVEDALLGGKVRLNQPWNGWIQYGKDATPQNFLGKKGIQLDNLIYEYKGSLSVPPLGR